jgi:hypothetical protein
MIEWAKKPCHATFPLRTVSLLSQQVYANPRHLFLHCSYIRVHTSTVCMVCLYIVRYTHSSHLQITILCGIEGLPKEYRSRIHERKISLKFLSIILRVLTLEVSVWISKTIMKGVRFGFLSGFPPFSFTVYSN